MHYRALLFATFIVALAMPASAMSREPASEADAALRTSHAGTITIGEDRSPALALGDTSGMGADGRLQADRNLSLVVRSRGGPAAIVASTPTGGIVRTRVLNGPSLSTTARLAL